MFVYVARQPIFDRRQKVFAYELLYRSSEDNYNPEADGNRATAEVITNGLLSIGLDKLTRRKKAFINFTGALLEDETALLLPSDYTAIEISRDVEASLPVVRACRRLKEKGYTLVIDDFRHHAANSSLLDLAAMIKVDYQLAGLPEQKAQINTFRRQGKAMIAKKIETVDQYGDAMAAGFDYFQGFFFCEPTVIKGKEIPGTKLQNLRLLQEIYRTDVDFDTVEALIKQDPSLSYKLLRFINSVAFPVRFPIRSIRQAMALLGQKEMIKWASLVALHNVGYDKPDELIVTAVSRAKFCESMALSTHLKERSADLFLTGLFSLLDTFLDTSMEIILEELPLAADIKEALTGKQGELKKILDLVILYEKGAWDKAFEIASSEFGIDEVEVMSYYLESLELADLNWK